MSYKFLLPPITLLPASIGSGNILQVSDILWNYILSNLPDDKWAYLAIDDGNNIEIIRIEGLIAPNFLVAARGRDGTKPLAFLAGATVKYAPTAEAIRDIELDILHITPTGIIHYYNGEFSVEPISIIGLGGAISGGIFTNHGVGCKPCQDPPAIPITLKPYRIVADGSLRITDDGSYRAYA